MASDLEELEVEEVSLVKSPANRKRFYLSKKAEQMNDITAAILALPDEDGVKPLEDIDKGEISKETAQVLGNVKKLLEAVKDELSPELMARLAESLGMSRERAEDEDAEKAKPEEDEEKLKAEDVFKSEDPQLVSLFKKNQELEALYKAELFEKKRAGYVAKAERELAEVPGIDSNELGLLLSDIDDLSPKHALKVEELLKSVSTFARQSNAFSEVGSAAPGIGSDSAKARLDSLARSKVAKSGGSYAERYVEVLGENPELYTQYKNEGV